MALTQAYLISTKNLEAILSAMKNAQAPERFSQRFLEDLGFQGKNDRSIINVLKALGFLDDTGAPTQRYFDFLDPSQSDTLLATGIREAYDDLFRINKSAHKMSASEVKGKLKTLTQGKKGDSVLDKMVSTFLALSALVDMDAIASTPSVPLANEVAGEDEVADHPEGKKTEPSPLRPTNERFTLSYDIHIHLPVTRDEAVYDALFRSLRTHLT